MSIPLVSNCPVPLDELQPAGLAREEPLDGVVNPGLGWFLIAVAVFDMVGNLFGVAVLSGTVLAAAAAKAGAWVSFGVLAAQCLCLLLGARLLARSPWRAWAVDVLADVRRAPRPALPGDRTFDPSALGLFALMLAGAVAVVGLAWPPALPVVAAAAAAPFAHPVVRFLAAVGRRALADTSSMTGLVAAAAVAVGGVVFVAGREGHAGDFFHACWVDGRYSYFRTVELFAAAVGLAWALLLPGTRLNSEDVVHVTSPRNPAAAYHDLSAFAKFRSRRVVAQLLMNDLREVVVLVRRSDGGYTAVRPEGPLELARFAYTVLYLPAVSRWTLAAGGAAALPDERGFLATSARLVAAPRMPAGDALPAEFAPGRLDPLLGLLRGGNATGELEAVARRAFWAYARRAATAGPTTWEAVEVQFEVLLGRVDDIPLSLPEGQTVRGNLLRPDEATVFAAMDDHQSCAAALFALERHRASGEEIVRAWLDQLQARVGANDGVAAAFDAEVRRCYAADGPLDLVNCLGVGVVTTVAAVGGQNPGRVLVKQLNDRAREARRYVLDRVAKNRDRVYDLLRARLAGGDAMKQEVLKAVIAAMPEILPFFRNRHDALVQFIEYAVTNLGGSGRTPGELRRLLETTRAAPPLATPPAPAGYP